MIIVISRFITCLAIFESKKNCYILSQFNLFYYITIASIQFQQINIAFSHTYFNFSHAGLLGYSEVVEEESKILEKGLNLEAKRLKTFAINSREVSHNYN